MKGDAGRLKKEHKQNWDKGHPNIKWKQYCPGCDKVLCSCKIVTNNKKEKR